MTDHLIRMTELALAAIELARQAEGVSTLASIEGNGAPTESAERLYERAMRSFEAIVAEINQTNLEQQ